MQPRQCADRPEGYTKLSFESAYLVRSNLDGHDPGAPSNVRIGNVATWSGGTVDLTIKNTTMYRVSSASSRAYARTESSQHTMVHVEAWTNTDMQPLSQAFNSIHNGLHGLFAQINVQTPTLESVAATGRSNRQVGFNFSFVDSVTDEPVVLKAFEFSLYDLDTGRFGGGRECILFPAIGGDKPTGRSGPIEYFDATRVTVGADPILDGYVSACGETSGDGFDNPTDPHALTSAQLAKSISTRYENTSWVQVAFRIECCDHGGRNFLIAGDSDVVPPCPFPPAPPLPPPSPTPPPAPPPPLQPRQCADRPEGYTKLSFESAYLVRSNLDGHDPGAPSNVRIGNVATWSGGTVDLTIKNTTMYRVSSASSRAYARTESSQHTMVHVEAWTNTDMQPLSQAFNSIHNGLHGLFAQINVQTPTLESVAATGRSNRQVGFNFSFVDSVTDEPVVLKAFEFSLYDLDTGRFGGGRECILFPAIGGDKPTGRSGPIEYFDATRVTVGADPILDGYVSACGETSGDGFDNPTDPHALTSAQLAKSISTRYENTSWVQVAFRIECCDHGGRNFLIAGDSNFLPPCQPPPSPAPPLQPAPPFIPSLAPSPSSQLPGEKESRRYEVVIIFTADANVDDFHATATAKMKSKVASAAGVVFDAVDVRVRAASVQVDIIISAADQTTSDAIAATMRTILPNASAARTFFGLQITEMPSVQSQFLTSVNPAAPSQPPPMPPPPAVPPLAASPVPLGMSPTLPPSSPSSQSTKPAPLIPPTTTPPPSSPPPVSLLPLSPHELVAPPLPAYPPPPWLPPPSPRPPTQPPPPNRHLTRHPAPFRSSHLCHHPFHMSLHLNLRLRRFPIHCHL